MTQKNGTQIRKKLKVVKGQTEMKLQKVMQVNLDELKTTKNFQMAKKKETPPEAYLVPAHRQRLSESLMSSPTILIGSGANTVFEAEQWVPMLRKCRRPVVRPALPGPTWTMPIFKKR